MAEPRTLALTVNGRQRTVEVEPRHTLADVLRHRLGLTGTHLGCEHGVCGACTVLLDGVPARACITLAVQAHERAVETVEGLAQGGLLNDLQQAFAEHAALQCGFCTPGFLLLAEGFLREGTAIADDELRELVASNICRCTGYEPIIAAIREVAEERNARRVPLPGGRAATRGQREAPPADPGPRARWSWRRTATPAVVVAGLLAAAVWRRRARPTGDPQ